jgi:hypothetical protein
MVDLQGRQEADDGIPAARVGAEAERNGERSAVLATSAISCSTGLRLTGRGSSSWRGSARSSNAVSMRAEATAATSQAMRHDVPGRTTAATSIIEPAPAGM